MITDLFSERIKVMKYISTDKAPAAIGPYSQAIVTGNLLFASGQIALNPATGAVKGETITEQTTTVCENIGEILKAAGTTYDKVVKTTCFLDEVYAKYFTGKPARSCVAVKDLPKKVLCEIEIIAEI